MGNEIGTRIIHGVEPDDPECIHIVEEAIGYINEIGFLPLFKNEIPGFSLEERTIPGIGDVTGKKIVYAMYHAGIIDESFESYKELSDRAYCQAKYVRMREAD